MLHNAAIHGGHLNVIAQHSLAEGDGHMDGNIVPVTLKHRVGLNGNMHDHIAGRAAVGTGIALAAQCNVLVIINTSGDIDLQALARGGLAGAAAGLARVADNGAAAAAVGAGFGAGTLGRTGAAAVGAGILAVDGDLLGAAVGGFLKGQDHAGLNIMALAGCIGGAGGRTAAKSAESTAKSAAKDIAKDVAQVHAAKTTAEPACTAAVGSRIVGVYAGKAELIIALAFLRVGKHIVGFVDLFELFLGFFIAGVQVRVVLFGKFAVGTLDLGIRGVFADAQHLVIISFFCHMITPLCVEVS